jgi:hypothetical protein
MLLHLFLYISLNAWGNIFVYFFNVFLVCLKCVYMFVSIDVQHFALLNVFTLRVVMPTTISA